MSETNSPTTAPGLKAHRDGSESARQVSTHEKVLPVERLRQAVALAAGVDTYEPNTKKRDVQQRYSRLELAHITAAICPSESIYQLVQLDSKRPMVEILRERTGVDGPEQHMSRPLVEAVAELGSIGVDVEAVLDQDTEGDR